MPTLDQMSRLFYFVRNLDIELARLDKKQGVHDKISVNEDRGWKEIDSSGERVTEWTNSHANTVHHIAAQSKAMIKQYGLFHY